MDSAIEPHRGRESRNSAAGAGLHSVGVSLNRRPRDQYDSGMTLALYCSVSEACRMAGVSDGYMRRMLREGKIEGAKVGNTYLVLRSSLKKFERQPGMGRPRKARAAALPHRRPGK